MGTNHTKDLPYFTDSIAANHTKVYYGLLKEPDLNIPLEEGGGTNRMRGGQTIQKFTDCVSINHTKVY